MILQALNTFYGRLRDDAGVDIPEPGFSNEKIHFQLVLTPEGELAQVENIQVPAPRGNRLLPRMLKVPQAVKRTAGAKANFLWDNTGYVLGADAKGKPERARGQFELFRELAHTVGDTVDDPGMRAVLAFLDAWTPEDAPALKHWDELAGRNVVFRMLGETAHVHDHPAVRRAWLRHMDSASDVPAAMCLVCGELAPVSRLHPSIKGVRGAQSSGASLVSFNLPAFTSYGKEQSYNAPVSEAATFAYTTALNHLLAGTRQKVLVGDATTLFWTEKPTQAEGLFSQFLDTKDEDRDSQDTELLQRLHALVDAVKKGEAPPVWEDNPETPFYVLGLSPNAARVSVRFWHVSDVGSMAQRLGQHFADLEIEKAHPNNPTFPSVWQMLIETAPQRKSENIPPTLGGELLRMIFTGAAYPNSLVARIIARIRADKQVSYLRAAMLKACYTRALRMGRMGRVANTITESEVAVSLDTESKNVGYRLGRLFAVLEKAQQDALPGINATIKDRFFGAASATPRSVFPRLIRLAQHHMAKAEYGYASDNRIAEIMEGLEAASLPAHLNMDDQAMFALGYYHQRNALYRKKETPAEKAEQ